jgi:hypothetical protein
MDDLGSTIARLRVFFERETDARRTHDPPIPGLFPFGALTRLAG